MNETHATDEQLSRLIDGELSLVARDSVLAHVHSCPSCANRHESLVEVAAALRLQPALAWDEPATAATVARLDRNRERNFSLPVAAALALVGAALVGVWTPIFSAGLGVTTTTLRAFATVVPSAAVFSPGGTVTSLFLVALLGPLLAYPLARWR
jgi:anti-sigma factor RsiW